VLTTKAKVGERLARPERLKLDEDQQSSSHIFKSEIMNSANDETRVYPLTPAALEAIGESLRGLRLGQVLLVIHEGVIV
jgi:hypothetical protein